MLVTSLLLTVQVLAGETGRFGLPACGGVGRQLVARTAFIMCFDAGYGVPVWAAYELTPDMLEGAAGQRQQFRHDGSIAGSATNADYRNSGLHRGHLVPAADVAASAVALRESYLLSNAIPQEPEVNLSGWRKIENDVRKLARQSDGVYVLTGALFDCGVVRRIGTRRIAVPCATFKVVLAVSGEVKAAFGVVLENRPGAARETVSVREVERRTGLDFWDGLAASEQERLEKAVLPLR